MDLGRIRVLEADPDLGAHIRRDLFERARLSCTVELTIPGREAWPPPSVERATELLGFLVLRGVVLQRTHLAGRETVDIFGPGDVVTPWGPLDDFAELLNPSRWQLIDDVALGVLDRQFLEEATPWPELVTALAERNARHGRSLISRLAVAQIPRVETRLRIVLWDLADRFGRVGREGVLLPLRLRHDVLAGLVSSSREAASRAVGGLQRDGLLVREPRGWLLRGGPPPETFAVEHDDVDGLDDAQPAAPGPTR